MLGVSCLYTQRLKVCPFQSVDTDQFLRLFTHPLVIKSLGAHRFSSHPHIVKQFLRQRSLRSLESNVSKSWFLYSFFDRTNYKLIGGGGIKVSPKYNNAEIFYLLFPEYWGQGLAVEAFTVLLDHLFRQLGLQTVIALIKPENVRAQRVAEKLGFRFLKSTKLNRYNQNIQVHQWTLSRI